jgi:hypothetical protein
VGNNVQSVLHLYTSFQQNDNFATLKCTHGFYGNIKAGRLQIHANHENFENVLKSKILSSEQRKQFSRWIQHLQPHVNQQNIGQNMPKK